VSLFSIKSLNWGHQVGSVFFRGLNLEIPKGKVVSFHGESGCGKTTLLQILGLLWSQKPLSGSIKYFSHNNMEFDLFTISSSKQDELRGGDFGFVLQNSYLIPHFSCLKNIAMPLFLNGKTEVDSLKKANALLYEIASANIEDKNPLTAISSNLAANVSQGQRQRLACLRALVNDPSVLFADEPTSNLDDSNSNYLFKLLKKWKQEKQYRSLLVINHNLSQSYDENGMNADLFVYMKRLEENSLEKSHEICVVDRKDVRSLEDLKQKFG